MSWAGASQALRLKKKVLQNFACDKIEAGEEGERESGGRGWGG